MKIQSTSSILVAIATLTTVYQSVNATSSDLCQQAFADIQQIVQENGKIATKDFLLTATFKESSGQETLVVSNQFVESGNCISIDMSKFPIDSSVVNASSVIANNDGYWLLISDCESPTTTDEEAYGDVIENNTWTTDFAACSNTPAKLEINITEVGQSNPNTQAPTPSAATTMTSSMFLLLPTFIMYFSL